MEITAINNQIVKETAKLQQKKYREETNLFLLEGYLYNLHIYKAIAESDHQFMK